MILYRIRNWSEWFENNRSKTVKDLSWVAIPNRHDGEHFSAIMLHPKGAEIFSAWILIVQVASRCQPRGSLLRDGGKPHTAQTLSVKTRAPAIWFETALDFLSSNTDWLETQTVADDCQRPASVLPSSCQLGDEEGMNGKEGIHAPPKASPASDETVAVFRRSVNKMFNLSENERWDYPEETALCEVLKRPDAKYELNEVIAFFNSIPPDQMKFDFPKSISKLFLGWKDVLGNARRGEKKPKVEQVDKPPTPKKDPNVWKYEGTTKGRTKGYTVTDPPKREDLPADKGFDMAFETCEILYGQWVERRNQMRVA